MSWASGQDVKRLRPAVARESGELFEIEGAEAGWFDRAKPPIPPEPGGAVFLDRLRGLHLVMDGAESAQWNGTRVLISGAIPEADLLRAQLDHFIGSALAAGTFPAIAETIVRHFETHDRPVADVWFPEQDITNGVLTVMAAEGRVGEATLAGGEHLNRRRIANGIRIRPGDIVRERAIQREIDWLNENPFHQATVRIFETDDASTALEFRLSNDRPVRLAAGYENSGVKLLGENRYFTGIAHGNVFGLGHQAEYQFFTGESPEKFRAHALTYRAPLPWRHILSFRGAFVESAAPLVVSGEPGNSDGESWLAGVEYRVPLNRTRHATHGVSAGFDFKSTNNNFEFAQADSFDTPIEVAQFEFGYEVLRRTEASATALDVSFVWSPGNLSGKNTDEAFQMTRPGAESGYVSLRADIEHLWALPIPAPGFDLALKASSQWSGNTLVAGEQFAPGGYDAVRGYDEREILGDSGFAVSAELYTPTMTIGPGDLSAALRLLAFVDYGMASNNTASNQLPDSTELASYGAGVRIRLSERAGLRFDYGRQMESGEGRGHVAVTLSF